MVALPALATIADLDRVLDRELTVDEVPRAEALIDYASALVRAYAGMTWAPPADVPAEIVTVVVTMVERATRNPDGLVQETAGPFSRSFAPDAAQRIYLSKGDKAIIRSVAGLSGLGTVSTTRGPLETPAVTSGPGTYPPALAEADPFSLLP